jgi:DNA-directed RNA polymerase II subunit RPB1
MNLFASQNVQTMSELMDLAAVPYMILAPRDGKPIVEVVQDTMLGAYRITKDWTTIHDKTMANLQMVNSYFTGKLPDPKHKSTHQFSGKQAYSQILPPGLFIEMKNKADEKFKIHNSEIISGTIDKTIYHALSRGMLPVIYHDYSPFEVRRFLDNTQRLICRWLMSAGFSVGISDLVTDKATEDKLKEAIRTYKGRAYLKIEDVRKGKLENNSIFTNQDFFEREILNVLNELTNQVGKIGLNQINEKTNRMINMVKSGSKGKETNVAQMIACVGQQNVDGKRVAYGFTDRTLPHYTKYDDGPEARGFVENSFISGLSPQEVFFHAMGGREGLIDTAVKTSETGYIQRRLVKAMEDCKVYYDQTVRNATGAIVQYVYGEDGIDGIKIENQYIPYISMNLIDIDIKYNLRPEEKLELYLTEDAMKEMMNEGEWMKDSQEYYEQLLDDRQYLIHNIFRDEKVDKIQYPIPFDRIIRNALQRLEQVAPTAVPTDLTPGYILKTLKKLTSKLKMLQKDQGIRFLHILLRLNLCPKILIMEHHMSKAIFEWLVNEIELRFMKSLVHPGEMVGIIAAQSIGELGTQQTLDSFHSSGTAAAVKATSGVPRLKELLSVSKNIKTPSLLICLKPDIGQVAAPAEKDDGTVEDPRVQESKEKCIKVMQQLEITRLVDILDSTEIFWDPPGDRGLQTGITDDDGMLAIYRTFANIDENQCRSQSPWVLRMKINKDRMYRLGLTMMDIYIKLHSAYHQSIECVFSDDNASELIFRIRLTKEALKDVDPDDYISALKAMEHNVVNNVLLKGLKSIKKVSMRSKNRSVYNPEKDKFEKVVEWMLDTDGTNLQDILANPNVDQYRTRSNDIYEIYQTLGIEAARNALYIEFMEVVGEGAINYRHMSLLLDTMTNRGTLMSVDRHGINRGDVGPLAKSSFEETTDMLINASMFSEHDRINGVSANIMLGQLPPCGTGDHDILLDEDAFIELMKDKRKLSKNKEYMRFNDPVDDSTYAEKEACAIENIAFNYTLPERNKNMKAFPKQSVTFV